MTAIDNRPLLTHGSRADPSDLLADHDPERALELAWERYETHIIAHAEVTGDRKVAW